MAKKKGNGFDSKLQRIADMIADQLLVGGDVAFDEKISAFKELRAYYAMLRKLTPDDEGAAFSGFKVQIANSGDRGRANGRGSVAVEPGADTGTPDF